MEPIRQSAFLPQCSVLSNLWTYLKLLRKAAQMLEPKYSSSGEAHPDSYKGCIVAKELQKIKFFLK